jgi:hypothetical protein
VSNLIESAERLLRGRARQGARSSERIGWLAPLACVAVFGAIYGALMGAYSGLAPGRWMQLVYSAIKVPLLLVATAAISLPSFCVINTLVGLRADLGRAVAALASSQAVLTIVLASLSPVTLVWYASSANYEAAVLFNGLMFGIAALGGQRALRRAYHPLIEADRRHRPMLRLWIVTYAFVGIQMGWLLRPFVGAPQHPPSLFREGAWDNAYEIVARMAWRMLTGSG